MARLQLILTAQQMHCVSVRSRLCRIIRCLNVMKSKSFRSGKNRLAGASVLRPVLTVRYIFVPECRILARPYSHAKIGDTLLIILLTTRNVFVQTDDEQEIIILE